MSTGASSGSLGLAGDASCGFESSDEIGFDSPSGEAKSFSASFLLANRLFMSFLLSSLLPPSSLGASVVVVVDVVTLSVSASGFAVVDGSSVVVDSLSPPLVSVVVDGAADASLSLVAGDFDGDTGSALVS